MTSRVQWKLVGRANRRLDEGIIDETYGSYGAAVAAISNLLRVCPEVCRVDAEGYWLARRSTEADIALWICVECSEDLPWTPADKLQLPA
jgi:hypothetical protein